MTVQDSEWRERTLQARRDLLRARGVPERFIEPIATRDDNAATFGGGVALLVPLFAALGLYWLGFQAYVRWRIAGVEAHAARAGAWLYAPSGVVDWIGVLGALFALIGAIGWVTALVTLRVPPYPAPSLAASTLRAPAGDHMARAVSEWLVRRAMLRRAQEAKSADELLLMVGQAQRRLWTVFTLAVGLPTLAAIGLGADGYWLAGPNGAVRHELWTTRAFAWSQAQTVVLGCNETKDSHDLKYEVVFPGWTQDLGNNGDSLGGATMPEAQRTEALAKADAVLRSLKVPRRRWVWLDKDPMHPACLAYWSAVADQVEPGRLKRLLSTAP